MNEIEMNEIEETKENEPNETKENETSEFGQFFIEFFSMLDILFIDDRKCDTDEIELFFHSLYYF